MQIQLTNLSAPAGDRGVGRGVIQSGNFLDFLLNILVQQEVKPGEEGLNNPAEEGGQSQEMELLFTPGNLILATGARETGEGQQLAAGLNRGTPIAATGMESGAAKEAGVKPGQSQGLNPMNLPNQVYYPGPGLKLEGLPGAGMGREAAAPGQAMAALMVSEAAKSNELSKGEALTRVITGESPAGSPARQGFTSPGSLVVNNPVAGNPGVPRENPSGSPPGGAEAGRSQEPVLAGTGVNSSKFVGVQGGSESAGISPQPVAALSLEQGTGPLQAASRLAEMMRVVPPKGSGQTTLSLKLEPANLGKLTINLNYAGGNLTAKFITASGYVKEIIDGIIPHLRELLAEHNIKLQEASAVVTNDQGRRGEGFEGQGRRGHKSPGGEQRDQSPEQESGRERQFMGRSLELNYLI
ncbi:MAG: flagellar hook-length control protein FliK [Bacillota bacterium]